MDRPRDHHTYPHPAVPIPRHIDYVNEDEYPSEDELSDGDLDILNTDYQLQRDLTLQPAFQPDHQNNSPVLSSLEKNNNSVDDICALSEKHPLNIHEWNRCSPRTTSLHKEDMRKESLRNIDYKIPKHDARAYQSYQRRRPLVDLIRNEWKSNSYTPSASTPASPGHSSPNWIQICSAPRVRRYMLLLLMLLSLTLGNWHYWVGPTWAEHRLLSQSLNERMKTGQGFFGENVRPEFLDLVQVKTLDQDLIPSKKHRKRLIVIGDVHGCSDERKSLLYFYVIYEDGHISNAPLWQWRICWQKCNTKQGLTI